MIAKFSCETIQDRRQWSTFLKVSRGKKLSTTEFYIQQKGIFKKGGEIKITGFDFKKPDRAT